MTTIPRDAASQTTPTASTAVKLGDLLPRTEPADALEFLDALHRGASGWVLLTLIARGRAGKKVLTGAERWADGRQTLAADPEFWRFSTDDWPRWDTYTAVCSFAKPPARGSRGLSKDALELPGVFADLDVKADDPGAFKTVAELERFLELLPPPSVRVDTGSGGAHVYWLTHERTRDPETRGHLLDGWYDYLTALAARTGRTVDHVQEPARILRVPGTIRWPRDRVGDPGAPRRVRLLRADGPRYTAGELLELSEPHRRVAVDRHVEHRSAWTGARQGRVAWLESLGLPSVQRAVLEERFNREEDWARLLLPLGWKLCADKRDGSRTGMDARYWWAPGKSERESGSASTDSSRGQPGTLFFYTTDPVFDPCLIPDGDRFRRITTKYHFALHFLFNGDEEALLKSIIHGNGRLA